MITIQIYPKSIYFYCATSTGCEKLTGLPDLEPLRERLDVLLKDQFCVSFTTFAWWVKTYACWTSAEWTKALCLGCGSIMIHTIPHKYTSISSNYPVILVCHRVYIYIYIIMNIYIYIMYIYIYMYYVCIYIYVLCILYIYVLCTRKLNGTIIYHIIEWYLLI